MGRRSQCRPRADGRASYAPLLTNLPVALQVFGHDPAWCYRIQKHGLPH